MTDSWDEMRRAKEEMYFEEENRRALARLQARGEKRGRPSPVTGEPMEEVTYQGVVIDRCSTSGGIWLDNGELEQIIAAATKGKQSGKYSEGEWLKNFVAFLKR